MSNANIFTDADISQVMAAGACSEETAIEHLRCNAGSVENAVLDAASDRVVDDLNSCPASELLD